jgi:hypothetical protein
MLSSLLAVSLILGSGVTHAQGPTGAPAAAPTEEAKNEAKTRFLKGVKLQEEGSLEAAIIEFERAYDLAPNYRVLYNIAVVYRDKGDKAAALRSFERYLADGGTELDAKRKKDVDGEIARLRDLVAYVTIKANVAGADVTLDDFPIGKTPISKVIYVNVGRRKLEISKDGYKGDQKIVTLAGGDRPTIEFTLKEIKKEPPPPIPTATAVPTATATAAPSAPTPPREDPGTSQRTLGYALGGVGIVGLGVGAAFGLLANSKWSSVKDVCKDTGAGRKCPTQADQDKAESAKSQANIGTLGFALGGTALAAGIVLLLTIPSAKEEPVVGSMPHGLRLSPLVGRQSGGVALDGRF